MQLTRFLALALLTVLSFQEVIAAPNLVSGAFKIKSASEGNPSVTINLTRPGWQSVYLNGPVKTWIVRKEGETSYILSAGGYRYTGIGNDEVIATIYREENVEWVVTYRQPQDAYTIEPMDARGKGWTMSSDTPNARVSVQQIIVQPNEPSQYSSSQLWRFEPQSN